MSKSNLPAEAVYVHLHKLSHSSDTAAQQKQPSRIRRTGRLQRVALGRGIVAGANERTRDHYTGAIEALRLIANDRIASTN